MSSKMATFSLILSGGVTTGLMGAFKKIHTSTNNLNRQLKDVNKTAGKIAEYRKLKKELSDLKLKMKAGGDEAVKAKKKWRQQAEQLRVVSRELKEAGINTKNLAAHERKLARDTAVLNRRLDALGKAGKFRQMREGAFDGGLTSLAGPVLALAAPLKLAAEFEEKMADIKKVVNFESPKAFQKMSDDILMMSTRIPMAAEGLADIVAAAGQSGIPKAELQAFAETAAKMGVAFDLSGAEAGKMMSDWRAGMNLSQQRVTKLADAVNHLSNNMNAAAPALGQVIQRQGAVAMQAGLTETQVAALGAAFLSSGASPEIAATGLKNFTNALTKGQAATKSQDAAFMELGLNAKDVAKSMQKDAQGTILKVLEAIGQVDQYKRSALVSQLFGEESKGAIMPLLSNLDNLRNAFGLVADETKYTGSMQKEFEERSKTTANSLFLLKNNVKVLGVMVGSVLLPALNKAVKATISFVQKLIEFRREHPRLTGALVGIAAGLTTGFVAFKSLGMITKFVIGGAGEFIMLLKAMPFKLSGVTTLIKGLGASLIACPWFWVVAGIVGIGVALHKLGVLKPMVDGLMGSLKAAWPVVKEALAPAFESVKAAIAPLPGILKEWGASINIGSWKEFGTVLGQVLGFALASVARLIAWNIKKFVAFGQGIGTVAGVVSIFVENAIKKIKGFTSSVTTTAKSIYTSIKTAMDDAITFLSSIDLTEIGMKLVQTLISGVKSLGGKLKQEFYDILPDFVKKSSAGAKMLGLPKGTDIPRRASGGPVSAGKPYIVGEKGPELFSPNGGGKIIPNNKINRNRRTRDNYQHLQDMAAEADEPASAPAPAPTRRSARDNYQQMKDLEAEANKPIAKAAPKAAPKASALTAKPMGTKPIPFMKKPAAASAVSKPKRKPTYIPNRRPARSGGGRSAGSGSGGGGGGINITMNVTISTGSGNPGEIQKAVSSGLSEGREKLKRSLEGLMKNERRLSFG